MLNQFKAPTHKSVGYAKGTHGYVTRQFIDANLSNDFYNLDSLNEDLNNIDRWDDNAYAVIQERLAHIQNQNEHFVLAGNPRIDDYNNAKNFLLSHVMDYLNYKLSESYVQMIKASEQGCVQYILDLSETSSTSSLSSTLSDSDSDQIDESDIEEDNLFDLEDSVYSTLSRKKLYSLYESGMKTNQIQEYPYFYARELVEIKTLVFKGTLSKNKERSSVIKVGLGDNQFAEADFNLLPNHLTNAAKDSFIHAFTNGYVKSSKGSNGLKSLKGHHNMFELKINGDERVLFIKHGNLIEPVLDNKGTIVVGNHKNISTLAGQYESAHVKIKRSQSI